MLHGHLQWPREMQALHDRSCFCVGTGLTWISSLAWLAIPASLWDRLLLDRIVYITMSSVCIIARRTSWSWSCPGLICGVLGFNETLGVQCDCRCPILRKHHHSSRIISSVDHCVTPFGFWEAYSNNQISDLDCRPRMRRR